MEDRETTAGHPTKGEKAEGRKSRVGLEMAGVESRSCRGLPWGGGRETNEAGIIRLPEPEVRLSPDSRTKFGQSPSR